MNGQYRLAGLPPGPYTIRAEKGKVQAEVLEGLLSVQVLQPSRICH